MNISHLVEKIKKGDNKSFEKLYKLTEREVWFTCISFLKNETTAQDIMQETYITAFLKIQSLEKSSQIRSWLNRIAVNKCKNYLKGKGEIQLDDEIFENQAIVDERISIPEEYISDKAKREIILSIMHVNKGPMMKAKTYENNLEFYDKETSTLVLDLATAF